MQEQVEEPATVEELQACLEQHYGCSEWESSYDEDVRFQCRCGEASAVFDTYGAGEAAMDEHIEAVSIAGRDYARSWFERHPQSRSAFVCW
jgi:hypothetical protein